MTEQQILTDIEMTHFIWKHTKGDGKKKLKLKQEWLEFTEQEYIENEFETKHNFIDRVNVWLRTHHIPIKIINFNVYDEDIGGTGWIVEEIEI